MPTTGISLVREQTEAMRLPRFLWVPFELGRPFGAPSEPEFQRRVLEDALGLFEVEGEPPVLADFPDDAPTSDDDVVWACPVSFAPTEASEADLVAAVRAEMGALAAWAEIAVAPRRHSDASLDDLVTLIAGAAAGEDLEPSGPPGAAPVEVLRLAADDLRTWYHHAAAQQPGAATSAELTTWFWQQTALGRLLGELTARLLEHRDPTLRVFAERAIVPRDHWAVVPESSTPSGEAND